MRESSMAAGLLLFLVKSVSASVMATATFSKENSGLIGTIRVLLGNVKVDLNFTGVNYTELGLPEECADEGLSFHMHTLWDHGTDADRSAGECAGEFTSGHYDPWLACGPASSNGDCLGKGGCVPTGTTWDEGEYTCYPERFDLVPYVCEVGDWSGVSK